MITTEQAVSDCFKKWRDYSGRAVRGEFWQFFLFVFLLLVLLGWLANDAVFWVGYGSTRADAVVAALFVSWLLLYVPFLSALARRFNDAGIPRYVAFGSVAVLIAGNVIFTAFHDQTIKAGFRYVVPITHAVALLLAALPSS